MSRTSLTGLLVGEHFRPPAKRILASLPAGARLSLQAEPENQYDPDAIKVLVDPKEIPESQFAALDQDLPEMGATLEQVMSGGLVFLGYIARSGGKPLRGTEYVGNQEFSEAMCDQSRITKLGFSPEGKGTVTVEWEQDEPQINPNEEEDDR